MRCRRGGCGNKLKVAANYPLERIHATCWALDPERTGVKERLERDKELRRRYVGRDPMKHPCRYQGDKTGRQAECRGCGGVKLYDLYACDIYAECLPYVLEDSQHCCRICDQYEAMEVS